MSQNGDWVWVRSKSCVTYDPITRHPNGLSIYTWIVRYVASDGPINGPYVLIDSCILINNYYCTKRKEKT